MPRLACPGKAGEQHADKRRAERRQHVDADDRAADGNPGEARDANSVADAVDAPPERRVRQKDDREDDEGDEEEDDRRHAGDMSSHEPAQERRGEAGRRSVGIKERGALQEAVHRQGHHDRRQTQRDDADAVDEADERRPAPIPPAARRGAPRRTPAPCRQAGCRRSRSSRARTGRVRRSGSPSPGQAPGWRGSPRGR